MSINDKLYDGVDDEQVETMIEMIKGALKYACEKYYLTEREINVLARLLLNIRNGNDDHLMYDHVVDFLWMAFRIGLNQKYLLLDLLYE